MRTRIPGRFVVESHPVFADDGYTAKGYHGVVVYEGAWLGDQVVYESSGMTNSADRAATDAEQVLVRALRMMLGYEDRVGR